MKVKKNLNFVFALAFFLNFETLSESSQGPDENRVLTTMRNVQSTLRKIEGYTCDVDQTFFQDGLESQRYRFKFYFKRENRIRVDFTSPYPSLTIFYTTGDKEATVMPFRFLPGLKFRFSVDSPMLKTLSGQRINQTDMDYFVEFVLKNLSEVKQEEQEFYEDEAQARFLLRSMDYIDGRRLEKYHISISKKFWLPIRIERSDLEGHLIEISDINNYHVNAHLSDRLFVP
jgi:outer membrane lipoprotein-sorting protein